MSTKDAIAIGLSAAIVSVERELPSVLVIARKDEADALPFGPFDPAQHRTLELGLHEWVGEQTRFELGYTEQLYTFGDKGRHTPAGGDKAHAKGAQRIISVGYLALTRQTDAIAPNGDWLPFPVPTPVSGVCMGQTVDGRVVLRVITLDGSAIDCVLDGVA